jgi:transcriptional regulator with XRE-family HTH domain
MNIGTAIKKLRRRECLLQEELANRIGITQTYLSQIENGHRKPSLDVLELMGKSLNLPLPLMLWFAVEESDIKPDKRDAYNILKPSIDTLINSLF